MIYRTKHILSAFLIASALFTGCSDEIMLPAEGPEQELEQTGDHLNFVVTLTDMSGVPFSENNPLAEWENYIDIRKFRVLFFDSQDKFLFESKSRWVKQLETSGDNKWIVSVPLYTSGNDYYNDNVKKTYDWDQIRDSLTSNSFKIALLVNRPDEDWYPSFSDIPDIPAHWYNNQGPFWGPDDTGKKDIFELHHSQYDPMYHGKGTSGGFYDFIMEDFDYSYRYQGNPRKMKNLLGSTSSWVNWTSNDPRGVIEKNTTKTDKKYFVLPSASHPIPMYGCQVFDAIKPSMWPKGTTFNLSDPIPGSIAAAKPYAKRSIPLLRSVVRLDLWIPSSYGKPDFVAMIYPNIYARCEPADVWHPTDSIWVDDHKDCKEIEYIMNYGPITRNGDGGTNTTKKLYEERMGWFYGSWIEKGWNFNKGNGSSIDSTFVKGKRTAGVTEYPRIFNSCIQRNGFVFCDTEGDVTRTYEPGTTTPTYYRYTVYTGERNVNDPSNLTQMGSSASGQPTIIYWMFNLGSKIYGLPIADYYEDSPVSACATKYESWTKTVFSNTSTVNNIPINVNTSCVDTYASAIMSISSAADAKQLPWPLVRNHVYRLTIEERGRGGDGALNVNSFKSHNPNL